MATPTQTQWDLDVAIRYAHSRMQRSLISLLGWTFALSQLVTVPAFLTALFLDGWTSKTGFEVSDSVIMFLEGVTVSATAGLITTAIRSFLKNSPDQG